MTPEQKQEFEKLVTDLQMPTEPEVPAEPEVLQESGVPLPEMPDQPQPAAFQAPEFGDLPEINVETPDISTPSHGPVDAIRDAFPKDATQQAYPMRGNDPFSQEVRKGQEDDFIVEPLSTGPQASGQTMPFDFKEVNVPLPDQFARAQQKVPQLEEFMADMAKDGKLNDQGEIEPEVFNMHLPDEAGDQTTIEQPRGPVPEKWAQQQKEFNERVVKAFETAFSSIEHLSARLQEVIDGHQRRRT